MVNIWIPKSILPNSFYHTLNCLDYILANKKEMFFRKYRDGEGVEVEDKKLVFGISGM